MDELREKLKNEKVFLDKHVDGNIRKFKMFNYIGIFLSASLIFSVITKMIFNSKAAVQMQLDKWSSTDVICATINLFANLAL